MIGMETRADVVRRFYAAFTERDVPGLLATLDPDIDFEPVLGVLYAQHRYHGHHEMRRWCEELAAEWESFETTVESAVERGDGSVVAFLRLVARREERSLEADIAVECDFAGDRISSITGRDAWEVAEELSVPPPAGRAR